MAILPNGSSSIGQIDLAKKQRPLRGEVGQYGVYDAYFHDGLNETYPQGWANLDQAHEDLDRNIFRDLSPTPKP